MKNLLNKSPENSNLNESSCVDKVQISIRQNGSLLFPACSWVLFSSPCEAVLETPRCLHLYRLG